MMSKVFHHIFSNLICIYLCCSLGRASSQELSRKAKNQYASIDSNEKPVGFPYFYYQQPDYPRDCTEAKIQCSANNQSGVFLIKPDGYPIPFEIYCDNTIDFGGWTVIYRFQDGSVLFNRNWTENKIGYGFLSQEFWLGNDKLSFLTNQKTYELRIDIAHTGGPSFYVMYKSFRISDEYGEYKLTNVGRYSGTEDEVNRFLCPSNSEGVVYVSPDCSQRCFCDRGQFSCDVYHCSPNALCVEKDAVLQCYCNAGYIGDGINCTIDIPPSDCQDIYDRVSNKSGVYKIKPTTWQGEPFDVYCNMTDGGGWTVFQRRVDGSQDFFLYWSDYKAGFGSPNHELWLGNDKLHSITTQKQYQLRVDVIKSLGNPYYAKHSSFRVSDENDNYRLSLGSHTEGGAGDAIDYNNGKAFTTRDRDNDDWSGVNCANYIYSNYCGSNCDQNGGWWYGCCSSAHLNGPYGSNCFSMHHLPGSHCYIKYVEMKLRPI